jgi:alpha-L-rhamnosidase
MSYVAPFLRARPVWLAGKKTEKNVMAAFRALFPGPDSGSCTLAIACASVYRVFVNGAFLGHGPARGPHGHFRVDVWDLDRLLKPGENVVALEVVGSNVNSYYTLDQPSFLQAEVLHQGASLAATGAHGNGFIGRRLRERLQRVLRYSFQRPFTEVWRLRPGWDSWRASSTQPFKAEELAEQPDKWLIPRRVPHCRFSRRAPMTVSGQGQLQTAVPVSSLWKDRSRTEIGAKFSGFPEAEIETLPSDDWQRTLLQRGGGVPRIYAPGEAIPLPARSWRQFDFGTNLSGFIGLRLVCRRATTLYAAFDEILANGQLDFRRLGCVNLVTWELQPGEYDLESFEPYTLRYLQLAVSDGDATISGAWLREYANDSVWEAEFACDDRRLVEVFEAGRETFRQNAIDIYMDCPSRERAGWLCDSFFTARSEIDLTGASLIEQSFLENFLLPERFEHLPAGMLPMCYPADHPDGVCIPNWALWFIIELEEYLGRTGDHDLVGRLQPRVLALIGFFDRFLNADGLLEKLESWVFLEWSKANEFTQDVNYPSNMLFAGALAAAGRIYKDQALLDRAGRITETIRAQSFDGQWFIDNAVRADGALAITANRSEVCQYYAFFFGIGDPRLPAHAELQARLVREFGPERAERGLHPEIHPANAFIGTYLRLELLSRWGRSQQLLDECVGYFHEMAGRTGTLWENLGAYASCNHGFASHVVRALYRDALGVRTLDPRARTIRLRLGESKLGWCQGRIPTADGPVHISWSLAGGHLRWRCQAPCGWTVSTEDAHGRALELADAGDRG